MIDFLTVCEGHSESDFCNQVLRPSLYPRGVDFAGKLVGKPNRKLPGIAGWARYQADLKRIAAEANQRKRYVGVLVDYYRMPLGWPGRRTASDQTLKQRGIHVEEELKRVADESYRDSFIPCVQLHEFESLLFCDPDTTGLAMSMGLGDFNEISCAASVEQMRVIIRDCGSDVEQINDHVTTNPAARVQRIFPGFSKPVQGVNALIECDVDLLRQNCVWLDRWLTAIEACV